LCETPAAPLAKRLADDKPYTWLDTSMVSINPFRTLGCNTDDSLKNHVKQQKEDEKNPHVWVQVDVCAIAPEYLPSMSSNAHTPKSQTLARRGANPSSSAGRVARGSPGTRSPS
jgi:hypothetical protein